MTTLASTAWKISEHGHKAERDSSSAVCDISSPDGSKCVSVYFEDGQLHLHAKYESQSFRQTVIRAITVRLTKRERKQLVDLLTGKLSPSGEYRFDNIAAGWKHRHGVLMVDVVYVPEDVAKAWGERVAAMLADGRRW